MIFQVVKNALWVTVEESKRKIQVCALLDVAYNFKDEHGDRKKNFDCDIVILLKQYLIVIVLNVSLFIILIFLCDSICLYTSSIH